MSWVWLGIGTAVIVGTVAYVIKLDREGRRAQAEHKRRMAQYAEAITQEWIVKDRER